MVEHSPKILAREEKATTTTVPVHKQTTKAQAGNEWWNILPISWHARKKAITSFMTRRKRATFPTLRHSDVVFLELILCADSYAVSVPPPCYRSGT